MFNRENGKKKPLSDRERETLKVLRTALPECDIHANMRLADVIKADWWQYNYIKSYHLDFVICDQDGHTIAAVELDDSTHDTPKAQRRDAKKDGWLHDAGIKLIRIRKPHEAEEIRRLIEEYQPKEILQELPSPPILQPGSTSSRIPTSPVPPIRPSSYTKPRRIGRSRHVTTQQIFTRMAVTVAGMFVVWIVFANFMGNQQKRMIEASQKAQQQVKQRAAEQQAEAQRRAQTAESLRRRQEAVSAAQTEQLKKFEQALIYQHELKVLAQQARYERVFVRAKSGEECRKGNIIDNEVVRCMTDHYEVVESKNGTP